MSGMDLSTRIERTIEDVWCLDSLSNLESEIRARIQVVVQRFSEIVSTANVSLEHREAAESKWRQLDRQRTQSRTQENLVKDVSGRGPSDTSAQEDEDTSQDFPVSVQEGMGFPRAQKLGMIKALTPVLSPEKKMELWCNPSPYTTEFLCSGFPRPEDRIIEIFSNQLLKMISIIDNGDERALNDRDTLNLLEDELSVLETALSQGIPPVQSKESIRDFQEVSEGPNLNELPQFIVPHSRNRDFTGRKIYLEELKESFDFENPRHGILSVVSLYGLGGIGKTQIALEFSYWVHEMHPSVSVYWIDATSQTRFRQSLLSISRAHEHLETQSETDLEPNTFDIGNLLEELNYSRWFLVLDGLDDEHQLYEHELESSSSSPERRASFLSHITNIRNDGILITTRDRKIGPKIFNNDIFNMKIPGMSPAECETLFLPQLSQQVERSRDLNKALFRLLEFHPLAITQAAGYISKTRTSVRHYIQALEEGDYAKLDETDETEGRESYPPIITTLIASFEQVKRLNPIAGSFLSLMSAFNPVEIPSTFLYKYCEYYYEDVDESSIQAGLEILVDFGFLPENEIDLSAEGVNPCFTMSWLVQQTVRFWLLRRGERPRYENRALRIVSESFPNGKEFENWKLCRDYHNQARFIAWFPSETSKYEVHRGTLLNNLGGFLHGVGDWDEAEDAYRAAADIRTNILGEEHPDTLDSRDDLAAVYMDQGMLQEADELAWAVIESRRKVLGEAHPDTLMSRANRAVILRRQGRIRDALSSGRKTLADCETNFGVGILQTLTVRAILASALRVNGDLSEAERLGTEVLRRMKLVLGEKHPMTMNGMSSLASVLLCQGRLKEVEALGTKVLELRRSILGEKHPFTLVSMSNLASIYWHQQRYREAEVVSNQALELQMTRIGESHPDALTTAANIASIYSSQRRFSEAEQLGSKILKSRERILGRDHPDTLTSMNNLASAQMHLKKFESAQKLSLEAFERRAKVLRKDHPSMLSSMNTLAHAQYKLGQEANAIQLMQDCVKARQFVLGGNDPRTLMSARILESWLED
ncbi:unnamed protein product [Clonostachys rosea]|uniref:NB-ARC domain-containing protein n=1 Tax=Bionectria ochroleuca TaxID=29856 RepID=A0ABY6U2H5_BIOOC|nr:unnamed protein product [Clonostachys rosea]